jgi:Protein of unknown function (DUF2961)
MRLNILTLLLILNLGLSAQQLYEFQAGVQSRLSSFENQNGSKGQGGRTNTGAKGNAFEPLKAGETKTLLEISSAGMIQRIWCTIDDRSPVMLRALRLRMYWDGEAKPAVDVPLGDFFGAGARPVAFESELLSDPEGRSFNCYIPMPFRKGARVTLTNEGTNDLKLLFFDIDFTTLPSLAKAALYFHACWTRTNHAPIGLDATILPKVYGHGRFLGTSIVVNVNAGYDPSWWGEGEVKGYLDRDSISPTINGTGAEDYIGTGWGEGTFAHRYQGCLVADGKSHQYAFYRFHVPDPIWFSADCRITIQQIGGFFADSVKSLQAHGVPLRPVTVSGADRFHRLFEPGESDALSHAGSHDWTNFYRSDDYAATAYFYLDRPTSDLPPLATVKERY